MRISDWSSDVCSSDLLKEAGHNTNVGDEGGFAPNLASTDEALGFIARAVKAAGYKLGDDVMLALDCAATEYFKKGKYHLAGEGKTLDAGAMVDYLAELCGRYPILSIEDGMSEDDWDGWAALTDNGRATCRDRGCQYVKNEEGGGALNKK